MLRDLVVAIVITALFCVVASAMGASVAQVAFVYMHF